MKVLLDTHAFLWWAVDSPRLSPLARKIIADGRNSIFFSSASGWEVAIKVRLGKLKLPSSPERFIPARLTRHAMQSLPVLLSHALRVGSLPEHHRDPFDRMLVAQSQLERMPILTSDPLIARYDVETIW